MKKFKSLMLSALLAISFFPASFAQNEEFTGLKADAVEAVDSMRKTTQVIVDSLFSFSELGFQEFERIPLPVREYKEMSCGRERFVLLWV